MGRYKVHNRKKHAKKITKWFKKDLEKVVEKINKELTKYCKTMPGSKNWFCMAGGKCGHPRKGKGKSNSVMHHYLAYKPEYRGHCGTFSSILKVDWEVGSDAPSAWVRKAIRSLKATVALCRHCHSKVYHKPKNHEPLDFDIKEVPFEHEYTNQAGKKVTFRCKLIVNAACKVEGRQVDH